MKQRTGPAIERLSFLVGEWRGRGTIRFDQQNVLQYEVKMACGQSPNKDILFIQHIADDPETDRMFHGDEGFIYVDQPTGELRRKRYWTTDGMVSTERVTLSADGRQIFFRLVESEGMPPGFTYTGTYNRVDDNELRFSGEVEEGPGKAFTFESSRIRVTKRKFYPTK